MYYLRNHTAIPRRRTGSGNRAALARDRGCSGRCGPLGVYPRGAGGVRSNPGSGADSPPCRWRIGPPCVAGESGEAPTTRIGARSRATHHPKQQPRNQPLAIRGKSGGLHSTRRSPSGFGHPAPTRRSFGPLEGRRGGYSYSLRAGTCPRRRPLRASECTTQSCEGVGAGAMRARARTSSPPGAAALCAGASPTPALDRGVGWRTSAGAGSKQALNSCSQ